MTVLLLTTDQLGDKALNDALGLRDYAQAVSEEVLRLTEALRKAERQRDSLARRCAVRFEESQRLERELADINSRVAEDERVFAAVGAYVAQTRQLMRSHFEPGARALELMAAWEARAARRALGHTAPSEPSGAHRCPTCDTPTQYASFSGGREYYCPKCDDNGLYPEGAAPPRVQMLAGGRFDELRTEMRAEIARRQHSAPSGWVADHQPPSLVMVREPNGAVHVRPGLGETLHRIETEFMVFVGDDPEKPKVSVLSDSVDEAAEVLAAMPGSAIAVRYVYAGDWAVNRAQPAVGSGEGQEAGA